MDKLPITVLIPTINAEGHIQELYNSISDVAEDVYIVDSLSIDSTVDIAQRLGIKIIQRPFVTSSDQFGWMLINLPVKTPWIFFMAQDERFSESLKNELAKVVLRDSPEAGFTVKWRLWFMGKPLHATSDNLRLLRTGKGRVTQVSCNEHFLVDGPIGKLNGILEHKDTLTLYEWYEKQNIYTSREAIGRFRDSCKDESPRLLGTRLQRKMFFKRFLTNIYFADWLMFLYYLMKFGVWKDGLNGLRWAALRVWVQKVVRLKMAEMKSTGLVPKLPEARHGDYDPRLLVTALQQQLVPESVERVQFAKTLPKHGGDR